MRRLSLPACLLVLVSACGGGDGGVGQPPAVVETVEAAETAPGALPDWMEPLLAQAGPEVALVFSTSDYGAGENRIGFLVVRDDGELVQAPDATVYVAPEGSADPVEVAATLEPIGPHVDPPGAPPHDHLDVTDIYVAHLELPEPGRYWVAVQPSGAEIQAVGTLDVRDRTLSPPVGSQAIASNNPTLDGAPAEEITTASPPDTELLRYSIADSLAAKAPFVVVFATPKFCQSRTCGPTVEVVDAVRREIGPRVRFIHVEIYEDNDPQKGLNRWVEEWNLPSEPFTFLVDRHGVIRAKFEGSVSAAELEAAVREHLL